MKKIVALIGSPRNSGNSTTLVNEIIKGAQDVGTETKSFSLSNFMIKPCSACYYCRKHDGCSIKDDMQNLYEHIKNADTVIISSPIYMFQITGQVKQVIDRLYPLLNGKNGKYNLRHGFKETIAVYSHGAPHGAFKDYIAHNNNALGLLGLKVSSTLICDLGNNLSRAATNKDLLNQAYAIGQKIGR